MSIDICLAMFFDRCVLRQVCLGANTEDAIVSQDCPLQRSNPIFDRRLTLESSSDLSICVSQNDGSDRSKPIEAGNGIMEYVIRYACWNPVLIQLTGARRRR